MRNPIRAKNLDLRFAPAGLLAGMLVLVSEPSRASLAIGLPWVAGGVLLRTWAVGHLVKTERFTCTGPYAHLRHPLYLGSAAIGVGLAAMLGGWAGVLGAAVVLSWFGARYLPRKERVETDRMLERHGEAYARYRSEVPALWPRWRAWRPASGSAPGHAGAAGDAGDAGHGSGSAPGRAGDTGHAGDGGETGQAGDTGHAGEAGETGGAPPAGWKLARYDANNELGTLLAVAAGVAIVCGRAAVA